MTPWDVSFFSSKNTPKVLLTYKLAFAKVEDGIVAVNFQGFKNSVCQE